MLKCSNRAFQLPTLFLIFWCALQDKPYALFGTCLGAITAYEVAQRATARGLPPPLAFFPAAVSPPHLYAMAVMKLYLAPGTRVDSTSFDTVINQLRNWKDIPKETLMMVRISWVLPE